MDKLIVSRNCCCWSGKGIFQGIIVGSFLSLSVWLSATDMKIGQSNVTFDEKGKISKIEFSGGLTEKFDVPHPFSYLETEDDRYETKGIQYKNNELTLVYEDGSSIVYGVDSSADLTYFEVKSLDLQSSPTLVTLAELPYPAEGEVRRVLNAADFQGHSLAIMAGNPDVLTGEGAGRTTALTRKGCRLEFIPSEEAKEGERSAEFRTVCDEKPGGWSMVQIPLQSDLNLDKLTGLTAWVHGDGNNQQLKFQFHDGGGGARDYYAAIDFQGWKRIEFKDIAYDSFKENIAKSLNIYYNGVPSGGDVVCLIDGIEANFRDDDGTTRTIVLEDFEKAKAPFWNSGEKTLSVKTASEYGFIPASFGVISTPTDEFFDGVKKFQKRAGINVPYLDGKWDKESKAAKESYLFLTSFNHEQFEEGLAIAKRGGFKRILFGQESWCESTGHFNIHPKNFPGGLPQLKETFDKFRAEGIECGLHFLAASIYPPDKYLTPVPDKRLITRATVELAETIDRTTTTIFVKDLPKDFPETDGGYNGNGTVLRIGDELISYGGFTKEAPYRFFDCVRGHLGTQAASHGKGDTVAHLWREYGYHMFDMDSSLFDEVTSNFAKVVNGVKADMVYFDGAERLQGDHARYNGRLIKGYHDKFNDKNILMQASSYNHYSWHLLARSASADGHGDLKGYLEERSPAFAGFREIGMPLDIGWYYGYDTAATPDMYEYILGMSLGYHTSVSYQVSVGAAANHPFTGQILDMIKKYESLRLNGGLPEELRPLFQVPKELQGKAPEDKTRPTHLRKDYRLAKHKGKEVFKRMQYPEWKTLEAGTTETVYDVSVTTESAKAGFQVQMLKGNPDDKINKITVEVNGQKMTWQGELVNEQYLLCLPGEKVAVYGLPLTEPQEEQMRAGWISLKEGEHKVTVRVEGSGKAKFRFRSVLELPEFFPVPENR